MGRSSRAGLWPHRSGCVSRVPRSGTNFFAGDHPLFRTNSPPLCLLRIAELVLLRVRIFDPLVVTFPRRPFRPGSMDGADARQRGEEQVGGTSISKSHPGFSPLALPSGSITSTRMTKLSLIEGERVPKICGIASRSGEDLTRLGEAISALPRNTKRSKISCDWSNPEKLKLLALRSGDLEESL